MKKIMVRALDNNCEIAREITDNYKKATLKAVADKYGVNVAKANIEYNGELCEVYYDNGVYYIMDHGEIVFTDGTDSQAIIDCM